MAAASKFPPVSPLAALLSLDVRCFLPSWTLAIGCRCGREHHGTIEDIGAGGLGRFDKRTLAHLVERLRCQGCGKPPVSVVAEGGRDGSRHLLRKD